MTRPVGFMDLELFRKIIDEAVPVDHIWLHHFGEPLLHPNLVNMVSYAKDAGIRQVGISSNATLLTKEKGEDLIDAGLDHLIISIDGMGDIYEEIRVGAKWDVVYRNVIEFLEMRVLGKPMTWIQIIDLPMVNIRETVDFWKPIAKKYFIDKIDVKKFDTWAHQVEAIRKIRSKKMVFPHQPCSFLWAAMIICWDGICVPCCRDYDAKLPLGNANDEHMMEIFNGLTYEKFRRVHEAGNFDNPLCRECVEWAEGKGIETEYEG